jgi:hypothetical protein
MSLNEKENQAKDTISGESTISLENKATGEQKNSIDHVTKSKYIYKEKTFNIILVDSFLISNDGIVVKEYTLLDGLCINYYIDKETLNYPSVTTNWLMDNNILEMTFRGWNSLAGSTLPVPSPVNWVRNGNLFMIVMHKIVGDLNHFTIQFMEGCNV